MFGPGTCISSALFGAEKRTLRSMSRTDMHCTATRRSEFSHASAGARPCLVLTHAPTRRRAPTCPKL
eukprot:2316739-Rhodomonas_salina.5